MTGLKTSHEPWLCQPRSLPEIVQFLISRHLPACSAELTTDEVHKRAEGRGRLSCTGAEQLQTLSQSAECVKPIDQGDATARQHHADKKSAQRTSSVALGGWLRCTGFLDICDVLVLNVEALAVQAILCAQLLKALVWCRYGAA